jgi:DNA excision repair protein ERCC-2
MSPLEMYPKMLNFKPKIVESINIDLARNSINPLIVTKGLEHLELSSEYTARGNIEITKSFGSMLIELCTFVPDGIVVFFPSYRYMEKVLQEWQLDNLFEEIRQYKALYIETKDVALTSVSLQHYKNACDIGRGGIFLSIARGKIAEGIDFEGHYGRCVLMLGFPVQNSNDPILIERMKYLDQTHGIKKDEYIEFDAMRQCA